MARAEQITVTKHVVHYSVRVPRGRVGHNTQEMYPGTVFWQTLPLTSQALSKDVTTANSSYPAER